MQRNRLLIKTHSKHEATEQQLSSSMSSMQQVADTTTKTMRTVGLIDGLLKFKAACDVERGVCKAKEATASREEANY